MGPWLGMLNFGRDGRAGSRPGAPPRRGSCGVGDERLGGERLGGERLGGERARLREEERRAAVEDARRRAGARDAGGGGERPEAGTGEPGPDELLKDRIGQLLGRMNDPAAVRGVRDAVRERLKELGRSSVVERYDHRDGYLQLEYRFSRRTGQRQGPYWSYRFWRDGRQRKIYLGKTDSPEELLEEKLLEETVRKGGGPR